MVPERREFPIQAVVTPQLPIDFSEANCVDVGKLLVDTAPTQTRSIVERKEPRLQIQVLRVEG